MSGRHSLGHICVMISRPRSIHFAPTVLPQDIRVSQIGMVFMNMNRE